MGKYRGFLPLLFLFAFIGCIFFTGTTYGAENSKEYLQYQEPQAPTYTSWLSTVAYVVSLLVTFALVIGLAYFASRFLGQRMGGATLNNNGKVVSYISLGQNKGIYVIDVLGRIFILGVTEHSMTVLKEITDTIEIEKIRAENIFEGSSNQFDQVLQKQLVYLQQLSKKFPIVFDADKKEEEKNSSEKRQERENEKK